MSGETLPLWGLVAAVTIITLIILVVPLMRRRGAASAAREVYDINVYKDQLEEIDRDLDRRLMDEAQAAAARVEIKRRMLSSASQVDTRKQEEKSDVTPSSNLVMIVAIVLVLPAAALATYLHLGRPGQPDLPFAERPAPTRLAANVENRELSSVTEQLKNRLQREPDDLRGWMLLGRSYMSLSQFADAAEAYGRAYGLSGEDGEIGSEYAEALSLAADSVITPLAHGIFRDALLTDPLNAKARFYLAMKLAQDGDIQGALQGWIDLAALSDPNAPWMPVLSAQISRAGQEIGVDPQTMEPSPKIKVLAASMPKAAPQMTPVPQASAPVAGPGPSRADVEAAAEMSGDDRNAMIRSMVERLADRLKDEPGDKAGWQRLERAYRVLGETAKADEAAAAAQKLP